MQTRKHKSDVTIKTKQSAIGGLLINSVTTREQLTSSFDSVKARRPVTNNGELSESLHYICTEVLNSALLVELCERHLEQGVGRHVIKNNRDAEVSYFLRHLHSETLRRFVVCLKLFQIEIIRLIDIRGVHKAGICQYGYLMTLCQLQIWSTIM